MPKLQHNFVQGKMNKELDERLVPNGQYRDALNIQVSTSEGSDVGAIENVLGNTKQNKKTASINWAANFGLTSPKCIGIARDTQNNKLYWFITASDGDAILEYDQSTGFIAPVIVDVRATSVLNFSTSYFITGANVFDGLLAWTDNNNEPRIINIATFKSGSTQSGTSLATTTQAYSSSDFTSAEISVIKKKPNNAPSITTSSTSRSGSTTGLGLNRVTCNKNFTETYNSNKVPVEVGSSQTFTASSAPNWVVGDVITLTTSELGLDDLENEYQVRMKLTAVSGTTITGTIQSISSDLPNVTYTWTCILDEEKPMFELQFPRFAYRWKYADGQYSAFSPWSQVAFEPGDFRYTFSEATNLGMVNNLRKLTLGNFETPPNDVVKIDILYKDSSETVCYKVDEVDDSTTTYSITSELIYHAINSDQIIRPYDNVPKKALAQEVIGNRLVYGNYTQNYTVPDFITNISLSLDSDDITTVKTPEESVKSLRTYQVGIVFLDEMGRETPVFTNDTASITVDKNISHKVNKIKADFDLGDNALSTLSDKFSHFKYYIKDTSTEYYNLVLDRYYATEDGNLWLSFPSAERNKVREGGFLHLKKKNKSDSSVEGPARYKVLDISNEAPRFIKTQRVSLSFAEITKGSDDAVAIGKKSFKFKGPDTDRTDAFRESIKGGNLIRFRNGTTISDYYEIQSGGFTNDSNDAYQITLTEKIKDDDSGAIPSGASTAFDCLVFEEKEVNKSQFEGRFFVKINRDVIFEENIIYNFTNNPDDYEIDSATELVVVGDTITDDPDSDIVSVESFGWAEHANAPDPSVTVHGKPSQNSKLLGFYYAPFDNTESPIFNSDTTAKKFNDNLAADTVLQFKDSTSGEFSKPYEVSSVAKGEYDRQSGTVNSAADEKGYYWNITLKENFQEEDWDTSSVRISKRKRLTTTPFDEYSESLASSNPAIFETEPIETADLDLYYEACDAQQIANLEIEIELPYFNCYSFGNGVESDRIRDDFNAKTITKGVKVSSTLDQPYVEETRGGGLIYSGIYNSMSGVNDLNQFIAGLKITKDLNPIYGSIQKLHARDTDLITLCEDKCFRILANKDALFNADGNANLTSNFNVLGQTLPFAGEFGISKNPETFTSYGFRAYFTDKARGTVLRLSADGLTEIANAGMSDFFEDKFKSHSGAIVGSYDEASGSYNVTFSGDESVSYKEGVGGWPTRLSFTPEAAISLNNEYYTVKDGELWEHSNTTRSNFYGTQEDTTVTLLVNDAPSSVKNFKTLAYEGDTGWTATVDTDQQDGAVSTWKEREGFYYNFISGKATTLSNIDTSELAVQGLGDLADDGTFGGGGYTLEINGSINTALQIGDAVYRNDGSTNTALGNVASINRSTNTISTTTSPVSPTPDAGDYLFFVKDTEKNTSGLIGYYGEVKMSTSSGDKKELFAVNSEVFISSE